jgi:hypothetical protein
VGTLGCRVFQIACVLLLSKKPNEKRLNLKNGVILHGFDSLYKQVLDIKDQLFYPKVQAEVEETFNDLKKSFESFQRKIQVVGLKAKHKKTSKLTPNDDSRHVQLINLEP